MIQSSIWEQDVAVSNANANERKGILWLFIVIDGKGRANNVAKSGQRKAKKEGLRISQPLDFMEPEGGFEPPTC